MHLEAIKNQNQVCRAQEGSSKPNFQPVGGKPGQSCLEVDNKQRRFLHIRIKSLGAQFPGEGGEPLRGVGRIKHLEKWVGIIMNGRSNM